MATTEKIICWFSEWILPLVIFLIALAYSIYILFSLWKNLYVIDHNWIYPPSTAVKVSAIAFTVTAIVAGLFGSSHWLSFGIGYTESGIISSKHYQGSLLHQFGCNGIGDRFVH